MLEWLDDGVDSHGERYLEMRRRLVSYFDRRNRPDADELVDETFNRIARTLEQTGAIATTPPARYCYVVARFVLLENLRRDRRFLPYDEARDAGERLTVAAMNGDNHGIHAPAARDVQRFAKRIRMQRIEATVARGIDAGTLWWGKKRAHGYHAASS